jgi:DNA repair protein RadC
MAISIRLKNQHLLWRAGFGPMAENTGTLDATSTKELWRILLKTSTKAPVKIEVAQNLFDAYKDMQDGATMQKGQLSNEQKKQLRIQSRDDIKNLNIRWLDEMINSEEKMH